MQLTISSPSSNSAWASPQSVSGTCDSNHTVSVHVAGPGTNVTKETTPNLSNNWSVDFSDTTFPATRVGGTLYTITASCGSPAESVTVNELTVSS